MVTPVIDADAHINEPADIWSARLPSKYADQGPQLVTNSAGFDTWMMNGRVLSLVSTNAMGAWDDFPNTMPKTLADTPPSSYDAEQRLRYMDEAAIWAQVLYPNVAGFGSQGFLSTDDETLKLLCVEAYNDFLVEWCSADADRLVGIMALPFWDVDASVREIERCAELGVRGALFTGEPQRFGMPPLGHPHWDRLYAALQSAAMPAHFHLGGGEVEAVFQQSGRSVLAERMEAHGRVGTAAYQMVELCLKNATQCGDIITCGVLPRFPELRFVSVESGAGWLPFVLAAADWSYQLASRPRAERYSKRSGGELLPSELFARQVYTTYWFEQIAPFADELPLDNLLFETDFPHSSCLYGDIQETIERSLGGAPESVRRKLLWDNAARLYGIPDAPAEWRAAVQRAA
jgi:predicted TIM-barrel fold metal-dependent hydrolase